MTITQVHYVLEVAKCKNISRAAERLFISQSALSQQIPEIVRFFDAHDEIEATFVTEAGRDYFTNLRDGTIDLALDRLPSEDFLKKRLEFYSRILVREHQCILMSPDDPRFCHSTLSIQELQGSTTISGLENSAEDQTLKNTCSKYNIVLNQVYRSDGIETNMNLVRNGNRIVLGPQSLADYYRVE